MNKQAAAHGPRAIRDELVRRLGEPAPGRMQLLSGPRQVGKTYLLQEILQAFPDLATYAAADSPGALLSGWWEARWGEAESIAAARGRAILLLDEIQYLPDWSRRLKAEHDRIARGGLPIHVVATGSSSLELGRGARETMAGRFEQVRLLHWSAGDLVTVFGLTGAEAIEHAWRFGTYPGAVGLRGEPERLRAYLRDAILEPALGRDLLALETIRRPALLRQIFAVAAGHPAEIVSLQKLRGELSDPGALATIAHYLALLEAAFLVAPVAKFSLLELRRRAAPPKLVVLNQGLLAAAQQGVALDRLEGQPMRGRWIENACIAFAWNAGQSITYWRQEPYEVDLVIHGDWGRWAIEIKTGRVAVRDLAGLLRFAELHRGFRPLLLGEPGARAVAEAAGVQFLPWREFLLTGPPQ